MNHQPVPLTPSEKRKIAQAFNVVLLPLANSTKIETEDEDNRFVSTDFLGIRTAKAEECSKQNHLSPNLLLSIIRCPNVPARTIEARLKCLESFFNPKTDDVYHWSLSLVFASEFASEGSGGEVTTIVLVRNYCMNPKERSSIATARGHVQLLEALTYDQVTSDAEENFNPLAPCVFNKEKYRQCLKNLFGEDASKVEFVSTSPTPSTPNQRTAARTTNTNKLLKWDVDEDVGCIGKGTFGQVCLGWLHIDNSDGSTAKRERVAIKVLSTGKSNAHIQNRDDAIAFNKEIQTMKRLKHDHIVQYYGSELNTNTGQLNIFCEYMPGGSLDNMIRCVKKGSPNGRGGLDIETVRCYGHQILSGLVYLHSELIAHLDLKPGNVLIGMNQLVKLADFDKCKKFGNDGNTFCSEKLSDSYIGTCLFSAPEVLNWHGQKISLKSDLWSFGATLVNMLTGELPWYEQKFEGAARVLGFMNQEQSKGGVTGGPVRSPEMQDIFKNNRPNAANRSDASSSNSIEDLLTQCFMKNHKNRPTSKALFDKHSFFHRERWDTTHKITRRRSSDAMPLEELFGNQENALSRESPQRKTIKKSFK